MFQALIKKFNIVFIFSLAFVCFATPSTALEVAGIEIPDSICIDHQTPLVLNGAGTREKLFTDIYVAALYLQQHSSDIQDIIQSNTPKRIALYFVYKEVSAEKLIEGWNDGFRLNLDVGEYAQLEQRLQQSYHFFEDMAAGDVIYLDYQPAIGTRLIVNNRLKGIIEGTDFYQAALKVWIGEHPAQQTLKLGMLGLTSKLTNIDW